MAAKVFRLSTGKSVTCFYEVNGDHYTVGIEIDFRKTVYEGDNFGEATKTYKELCDHYKERERTQDVEGD